MKRYYTVLFALVMTVGCGGGGGGKPEGAQSGVPVIEGLIEEIYISEDTEFTLSTSHLQVTDPDSNSDEFVLTVRDGENYTAVGNTISPAENFEGPLIVLIQVGDGVNTSNIFYATIVVVGKNDNPFISGQPQTEINEDEAYTFTPQVQDVDAGDTLTFVIVNKPSWASFDEQTGTLSGKPTNDNVGIFSNIQISVQDKSGASNSLSSFSIEVKNVNDAPIAYSQTITIGSTATLEIVLKASDPDGDPINYQITSNPGKGTLTDGTMKNISVANGSPYVVDGSLKYTTNLNAEGDDSFTFVATDGEYTSESAQVDIKISENNKGTVTIVGYLYEGRTLTAEIEDPDGIDTTKPTNFKWRRLSLDSEVISTSDSLNLVSEDVGEKIMVEVDYTDKRGNEESEIIAYTESLIEQFPVYKKTINQGDAKEGKMAVLLSELSDFGIKSLEKYTVKDLSGGELVSVVPALLPDKNIDAVKDSDGNINHHPIYGSQTFVAMYKWDLLKASSEFKSNDQAIQFEQDIVLPKSLYIDKDEETVIGKSYSLGLFNQDNDLAVIVNIRIEPDETYEFCLAAAEPATISRRPVMLAPGFLGYEEMPLFEVSYWNKIPEKMSEAGAPIFSVNLSPWATNEKRGEELIAAILCAVEKYDYKRADLMGHSQGSFAARYAAYWLDKHEGHTPSDDETVVNSVTSITGNNYGANTHIISKDHYNGVMTTMETIYKLAQLPTDYAAADLFFKLFPRDELLDTETHMGKQYQLALDVLKEVKPWVTEWVGFVEKIENVLDKIAGDEGAATVWGANEEYGFVLLDEKLNNLSLLLDWTDLEPELLRGLGRDLYDHVNKIEESGKKLLSSVSEIKEPLRDIESFGGKVLFELQKVEDSDREIDVDVLMDESQILQNKITDIFGHGNEDVQNIVDNLSDFSNALNSFVRTVEAIVNMLEDDIDTDRWLIKDEWVDDILTALVGLKQEEVEILIVALNRFNDFFTTTTDSANESSDTFAKLGQEFLDIDIASLIEGFASNSKNARFHAQKVIALATKYESLIEKFTVVIRDNAELLGENGPKTHVNVDGSSEMIEVGFRKLADALKPLADHIESMDSADDIKDTITALMDDNSSGNLDWAGALDWQFDQIAKIQDQIIEKLEPFVKVTDGVDLTDAVKSCFIDNESLNSYFKNPRDENGNIKLPEFSGDDYDCSNIAKILTNGVVDFYVPIDSHDTQKIANALFSTGHLGTQIFNITFPGTGLEEGRYRECMDETKNDEYSSDYGYSQNQDSTKYYSIVSEIPYQSSVFDTTKDTIDDRIIKNLFTRSNNSDPKSFLPNVFDLMSSIILTDGKNNTDINGERSDFNELQKNTDLVVHVCSQELGEVSKSLTLNHLAVINNTFVSNTNRELVDFILGKDIEGVASIKDDLKKCHHPSVSDIKEQRDCLSELFPRLTTMFITHDTTKSLYSFAYYDNYRSTSLDAITDLSLNDAVKQGYSNRITVKNRPESLEEYFAVVYEGQIEVEDPDYYHFKICSDDGSKLYINDNLVLDNDGLHESECMDTEEVISLEDGTHKLKVEYFNHSGPGSLSLYYKIGIGSENENENDWKPFHTDNSYKMTSDKGQITWFDYLLNLLHKNEDFIIDNVADPNNENNTSYVPDIYKDYLQGLD